jgi:excisionase family DNA binding protein
MIKGNMAESQLADRLLKPAEAAKYLQLGEGTVRNMAARGELPKVKIGKSLRFRLSALDEWVRAREASPAETAAA